MKSPMVESLLPHTADDFTELHVLWSNAGYYIGTLYKEAAVQDGVIYIPGSRDSGYFNTSKEAQDLLDLCNAGDPVALSNLRTEP